MDLGQYSRRPPERIQLMGYGSFMVTFRGNKSRIMDRNI
jgi:hypothetical protein